MNGGGVSDDLIRVSGPRENFTKTGLVSSYSVFCEHRGLHEHREVKSSDRNVLTNKVQALLVQWEQKWAKVQAHNAKVQSVQAAETATAQAQEQLEDCETILKYTLLVDDKVDWNKLKRHKPFKWEHPSSAHIKYKPSTGEPTGIEEEPAVQVVDANAFKAKLGLLDFLIPPLRRKKEEDARQRLDTAEANRQQRQSQVNARNAARKKLLAEEQAKFNAQRQQFEQQQAEAAAKIEAMRLAWMRKDPGAVEEHAQLVLESSVYPEWFSFDFDLAFEAESGMLVVDYQLPPPDAIPTLERVTFVKSRNETVEKRISESRARALFDSVCYQVALRTMHELFEADAVNALSSITFNGWVEATNKATGRLEKNCILSVQATKAEFLTFDLAKVDPKSCFQSLRGVAASSLSHLAAVRPILKLDRADSRFVSSRDVAGSLDESTNLAAMSWEDFEHLVRELFGKIFSGPGAEVHVTQASRDGGVDAIALDPDPIKGGKIVIQAKRYSGTVGVGYVRDLYGTVLNEGANRGILVTTATFGPDAYKFATGKPLTLINGSNLLSLLADHGHKARIDLAEAKKVLREMREN